MDTIRSKVRKSHTAFDRHRQVLVGRMGRAGADFVAATTEATHTFGRFLGDESLQWWEYLRDELADAPAQLNTARGTPIERELLLQLARLLDALQAKVQQRIRQLAQSAEADDRSGLPLPRYDTLTARDIIARAGDLSAQQREAVHAYESRHTRRATVLRALEPRASA